MFTNNNLYSKDVFSFLKNDSGFLLSENALELSCEYAWLRHYTYLIKKAKNEWRKKVIESLRVKCYAEEAKKILHRIYMICITRSYISENMEFHKHISKEFGDYKLSKIFLSLLDTNRSHIEKNIILKNLPYFDHMQLGIIYESCKINSVAHIQYIMLNNPEFKSNILFHTIKNRRISLLKYLLKIGLELNMGCFREVLITGNEKLYGIMMDYISDSWWYRSMEYAAEGGNLKIFQECEKKDVDSSLIDILGNAAHHGHENIIEYIVSKQPYNYLYDDILIQACNGGQEKIVEKYLNHTDEPGVINSCLKLAIKKDNIELANRVYQKRTALYWQETIYDLCFQGCESYFENNNRNKKVVEFLISQWE